VRGQERHFHFSAKFSLSVVSFQMNQRRRPVESSIWMKNGMQRITSHRRSSSLS
jgi:hypothetical protein